MESSLKYIIIIDQPRKDFRMEQILKIAQKLNLSEPDLNFYGPYIAKINSNACSRFNQAPKGKLILVSSINPTPSGEGKTTISIGLLDAFYEIGKRAALSLREPSLGPVFGMKGGATGAGLAKIEPSDEINLHFTGDLHAVTAANNLLCALVDNHLFQGNELKINPKTIALRRCVDINDRALRKIVVGLGDGGGVLREESFTITAASEIMAILCLASDLNDLEQRLGNVLIGFSSEGAPLFVKDLHVQGALAVLLKNAILPNLVQTLKGSPVLVHGGPFANIAHGCCSIQATSLALGLADYVVTEAGFGADLGAEKFFNIKCRAAGLKPSAVVLVITSKALKFHGGVGKAELLLENVKAVQAGFCNLKKHVENIRRFGVEVVVAINQFAGDFKSELDEIKRFCEQELGCFCEICNVAQNGAKGATALAQRLVELCSKPVKFKFLYDNNELGLKEKTEKICTEIYGAAQVSFSKKARQQVQLFEDMGFGNLPVCMCKTPYSLSTDKSLVGRPSGFKVEVEGAALSAGAGFVVILTGSVMTMPGFGKKPAASQIRLNEKGQVEGLF